MQPEGAPAAPRTGDALAAPAREALAPDVGEIAAHGRPAAAAPAARDHAPLRRTGDRPRRTIAISGASGGAGKTVLACNLAIYLSTLGRTTLVVDADRAGAHLHTLLGVAPRLPGQPGQRPSTARSAQPAPATLTPSRPPDLDAAAERCAEDAPWQGAPADIPSALEASVETTGIPSLFFLRGASLDECVLAARGDADQAAPPHGVAHPPSARSHRTLMSALDTVDCDYLVLDLGAGIDGELLDVYLGAEIALFVTVPEPPAVEATYRFVRALFLRALLARAPSEALAASVRSLARELGGLPVPRELVEALEADEHPLAEAARALLASQELCFVLNQTRVRTDLEVGENMRSAAWQRLGVSLHYLGAIDHDDNVWSSVRAGKPLLVKSPGTKASKSVEKLARRLLALDVRKGPARPPRTVPRGSHHELLEIDRGATDEEIRRAYRRMREVYADQALCCYGLYTEGELAQVRAHLDEAFDVLLDKARRRPYELTVFPDADLPPPEEAAPEAGVRDLPPPPPITPDTEFDGSLLRAVRESQGLDLKQISKRTKINLAYLEALEGDDFEALPALVYVRGFVSEMAKCLRLDPAQVAHTYVRRVKLHEAGEPA